MQARRTSLDLAKIASHVLEIIRCVKIPQDIMVLCTNSGCFENTKSKTLYLVKIQKSFNRCIWVVAAINCKIVLFDRFG